MKEYVRNYISLAHAVGDYPESEITLDHKTECLQTVEKIKKPGLFRAS